MPCGSRASACLCSSATCSLERDGPADLPAFAERRPASIRIFAFERRLAFDGLHIRDGLRRAADRLVDGALVATRNRADRHCDLSAATVLTAMAPGFWTMMLCRGLTGIGEAMQLTALLAIAGSYFAKHRSLAVGAVNTSSASAPSSARRWGARSSPRITPGMRRCLPSALWALSPLR